MKQTQVTVNKAKVGKKELAKKKKEMYKNKEKPNFDFTRGHYFRGV